MATKKKINQKSPKISTPRVRSLPKHRSFRLTPKKMRQARPIVTTWQLIKKTLRLLLDHKLTFGLLILAHVISTLILVHGFGTTQNLTEFKQEIEEFLGSDIDQLGTGLTLFGILAASLGAQASEVVGAYQSFLIVIFSLASIWLTRQFLLNETPRLRDAFYKGMYPLIPFILVLFVVALQLLPALFGNFLYSVVTQQGLAVTAIERLIWLILLLLLVALSLYMIISSLFALYIVTLPDMTPLKALRSARELVLHRRLKILVRIVAMPLILVLLAVLIFVPLLIFATPLAEPLFLLASSFALVVIHVYFYNVYRALL